MRGGLSFIYVRPSFQSGVNNNTGNAAKVRPFTGKLDSIATGELLAEFAEVLMIIDGESQIGDFLSLMAA